MKSISFMKDYAKALLTYSAKTIAQFYQVPLTVYSDDGIIQVTKISEVEDFWKKGIEPYKKQDIIKSVPEIVSEEQLSKSIYICKVLWKNYNKIDKVVARETNLYILIEHHNELKISGLIIMANKI